MNRGPDGAFVSRGAMMPAWLPVFLGWMWRDPLQNMLREAAKWCVEMAAYECDSNARHLREHQDQRQMWLAPIQRVEEWKKRREILFAAIAQLDEIDKPDF